MGEGKEYIATVTSKGQVTIPAEVREQLGLTAQDKVIFRLIDDKRVEIEPLAMTFDDAYGSVMPLNQPEDFDAIHRIANEEREERWLKRVKK